LEKAMGDGKRIIGGGEGGETKLLGRYILSISPGNCHPCVLKIV